MLSRGTNSHKTLRISRAQSKTDCSFQVSLVEDSVPEAAGKGVNENRWMTEHEKPRVSPTENIVALKSGNASTVDSRTCSEEYRYLSFPEKAMRFRPENNVRILGQAMKHGDGLFYIGIIKVVFQIVVPK